MSRSCLGLLLEQHDWPTCTGAANHVLNSARGGTSCSGPLAGTTQIPCELILIQLERNLWNMANQSLWQRCVWFLWAFGWVGQHLSIAAPSNAWRVDDNSPICARQHPQCPFLNIITCSATAPSTCNCYLLITQLAGSEQRHPFTTGKHLETLCQLVSADKPSTRASVQEQSWDQQKQLPSALLSGHSAKYLHQWIRQDYQAPIATMRRADGAITMNFQEIHQILTEAWKPIFARWKQKEEEPRYTELEKQFA